MKKDLIDGYLIWFPFWSFCVWESIIDLIVQVRGFYPGTLVFFTDQICHNNINWNICVVKSGIQHQ